MYFQPFLVFKAPKAIQLDLESDLGHDVIHSAQSRDESDYSSDEHNEVSPRADRRSLNPLHSMASDQYEQERAQSMYEDRFNDSARKRMQSSPRNRPNNKLASARNFNELVIDLNFSQREIQPVDLEAPGLATTKRLSNMSRRQQRGEKSISGFSVEHATPYEIEAMQQNTFLSVIVNNAASAESGLAFAEFVKAVCEQNTHSTDLGGKGATLMRQSEGQKKKKVEPSQPSSIFGNLFRKKQPNQATEGNDNSSEGSAESEFLLNHVANTQVVQEESRHSRRHSMASYRAENYEVQQVGAQDSETLRLEVKINPTVSLQ